MAVFLPPHAPMFHLDRYRTELDLFFLLIFFHVDHLFALVMSAARADSVGQSHLTAIGALHQVLGFQRILRAAAISAASGKFTLWLWGHVLLPVPVPVENWISMDNFHDNACPLGRQVDYTGMISKCQGIITLKEDRGELISILAGKRRFSLEIQDGE